MYIITHTVASVDVKKYIDTYRDVDKFILFCKRCDRYGALWSCPPFGFDILGYLSDYKKAYIIGTKVINESRADFSQIMEEVRKVLDEELLAMEKKYPGSRAFFAGSCLLCPAGECQRRKGNPCISPDKVRPSLESLGFDIVKTSSQLLGIELLWGENGILPEYLTLVSALFI